MARPFVFSAAENESEAVAEDSCGAHEATSNSLSVPAEGDAFPFSQRQGNRAEIRTRVDAETHGEEQAVLVSNLKRHHGNRTGNVSNRVISQRDADFHS